MNFINTSQLKRSDKEEILSVWNSEYPEKLKYNSLVEFDDYLKRLSDPNHILLRDADQKIQGWCFDFIRNRERWFAILLDAKIHGKGFGAQLLELGKQQNSVLNGWVIDHPNDAKSNGESYKSPLEFYLKNGFVVLDERLELEKISAVRIQWREL